MTLQAKSMSTGEPVAATLTTEFQAPYTVEQVDTNRKETVRRFVEQFDNHPSRNVLLKDFEKSEEINHFSEESKDLITDMGNNEIFEFCKTSSKRQCPELRLMLENWYRRLHMRKMHAAFGKRVDNKDRYDSLSIPGYVIKKNQARGPRHGQSMRQIMYHKGRDMLRKDKLLKNGSCETILERWYTDADRLSNVIV